MAGEQAGTRGPAGAALNPGHCSAADAMRDNGFSDADIKLAFGYVPPTLSAREWDGLFGVDDFADLAWDESEVRESPQAVR